MIKQLEEKIKYLKIERENTTDKRMKQNFTNWIEQLESRIKQLKKA